MQTKPQPFIKLVSLLWGSFSPTKKMEGSEEGGPSEPSALATGSFCLCLWHVLHLYSIMFNAQ